MKIVLRMEALPEGCRDFEVSTEVDDVAELPRVLGEAMQTAVAHLQIKGVLPDPMAAVLMDLGMKRAPDGSIVRA